MCGFEREFHLIERGLDDYLMRFLAAQQPNASGVQQGE